MIPRPRAELVRDFFAFRPARSGATMTTRPLASLAELTRDLARADELSLSLGLGGLTVDPRFLAALADAPPPPVAAAPAVAPDAPDVAVDDALTALDTAIKTAIAAEQADMAEDGATEPSEVLVGLQGLADQLAQVKVKQTADEASEAEEGGAGEGDGEAPAAPPAAAAATTGEAFAAPGPAPTAEPGQVPPSVPANNPSTPEGEVDNDVVCATDGCGHLASAHADMPGGDNTGACSMVNCTCEAMAVPEQGTNTGTTGTAPAPAGGPEDESNAPAPAAPQAAAAAGGVATFAPAPPAVAPAAPAADVEVDPGVQAPPVPPGDGIAGPRFDIPVAWVEGSPTGDDRLIAPGALTWRTPPLPLMYLKVNSAFGHEGAVLAGRIDTVERDPVNPALGRMSGNLLTNEDGQECAQALQEMGRLGVSIDVGAVDSETTIVPGIDGELDLDDLFGGVLETLIRGEVMGATVCPFPAFAGAYIVLGDGSEPPPIPAQQPTPEQMAVMEEMRRERRLSVNVIPSEECSPCREGAPLLASGGPLAPPRAWFGDPGFHVGDERLSEFRDPRTGRATGRFACPVTVVTDASGHPTGEVYGHIAPWGVCHVGILGQCVTAPRSQSGYALWYTGSVVTAEGEKVRTGPLTIDANHAPKATAKGAALTERQTQAHYDNTGAAVAHVSVGEDDFGIWFHGTLDPRATPEQVYSLGAASLSGDWRGNPYELCAALAVNRPGFPIAIVADGAPAALIAAGAHEMALLRVEEEAVELTAEQRLAAMERAFAPLIPLAVSQERMRMERLRRPAS